MNDDCEFCGALWTRHSLSRVRPECDCGKRICWKCPQVRCFRCDLLLHPACSHLLDEDHYCGECYTAALREALKDAPLLEQLERSVQWAEEMRRKA